VTCVRYAAWLHTAPERAKSDKSTEPNPTRIEKMRLDRKDPDFQPEMPPVECGGYLLTYFWEIGPVMPGGMSSAPITHFEIAAWAALVDIRLQPWEARLLRSLSREYLAQCRLAEKATCEAPWKPEDHQVDKNAVAKSMREAIRAMAK
jgi:hypothetical protein